MSLSKTSGKQAVAKKSKATYIAGTTIAETTNGHGVVAGASYNEKTRKIVTQPKTFKESNLVVVTINSDLDKVISAEKPNAKAESAKQMFSNYRNKR